MLTFSLARREVLIGHAKKERFEQLLEQSYRQAYGLAYRLTGNAAEAEDLLQEAYVRAYRFFHRYDESLPFSSWLYRIVTNQYIDSIRRKGRLKTSSLDQAGFDGSTTWDVADSDPNPERMLLDRTLDGPLQLGLMAMNPEFRIAVMLADIEGMAYEEVAETMGTSVGTVRSRIHRGRKQLREYLNRYFPAQFAEGGIR